MTLILSMDAVRERWND